MTGLIVDCFAGGGGASTGIERALGRPVDIAINHDAAAVAMHRANHPLSRHYCENVFAVNPFVATGGRPVSGAWFSPDCTDHSKAKGGKPRRKHIRGLAWVVPKWTRAVRPDVIFLENVEEFEDWGPLTVDGQRCPVRKGRTFKFWCDTLRRQGYVLDWRQLRACDYGAPTIRKRLFLIGRCDGAPIVWPKPTHGPGLIPYRTAADCIDWSLPCPSIFLSKEEGRALGCKRPLVDATMRRIARGVMRYVVNAADPFIVPVTHRGDDRVHSVREPLRTVTTARRGEFALVMPHLSRQFGRSVGGDIANPVGTITAGGGGKTALVAAFLAQHNGGPRNENAVGRAADAPLSTMTTRGTQQQIVASSLVKLRGTCKDGQPVTDPMPTVTASGTHVSEVRAFLMKYYGTDQDPRLAEPLHTVTTKDRFGLVTVQVAGEEYYIADIGMRMLTARELYRAQGFPDSYIIDPAVDGKPLTKGEQVRMCGNSVCPDVAAAVVRANMPTARAADMPFSEFREAP